MVLGCRKDYLSFVNEGTGVLKNGTDPVDGIFSGADWKGFLLPGAVRVAAGLKDEGLFVEHAIKSHSAAFYQDSKDEVAKTLEPFTQQLCGFEGSWCLPRSLLRCAVPGGDSTPVHYDQIFLRGGPPTSITAWVPIGDVEIASGGLIYLEGSHKLGVDLERKFSEQNAGLTKEERVSAFNKNMMAGGWLSRNAGEYGAERKLNWLVVSHVPILTQRIELIVDRERTKLEMLSFTTLT